MLLAGTVELVSTENIQVVVVTLVVFTITELSLKNTTLATLERYNIILYRSAWYETLAS
jgi:hypothetical protein